MFNKFLAAGFVFAFLINCVVAGVANVPAPAPDAPNVKRAKSEQLLNRLPESDAVVTVDVQRLINSGLPSLLAGNQTLLRSVMDKIGDLHKNTGIDIKKFDLLVAGIKSVKVKEGEFDFHPVIIARGNVNSAELIQAAKKAANNKFKEETIGDRSFIIFKTEHLAEKVVKDAAEKEAGLVDKAITKMSREIAVTALDAGTIAFGEPSRIRQTIEGNSKVSREVLNLLNRTQFAMANVAATVPYGMSSILPLDDDDLGQNIDAIKQLFGSMDVNDSGAVFNLTLKTAQNSQAEILFETINGMRSIGGAILGSSQRDDQKLYAKVIDYLKVSHNGNEVAFDLALPQSDVNALSALIK